MNPSKLKQLEQRVDSKIHFGDTEDKVSQWLVGEMGIRAEIAEEMIVKAMKKRSHSIRTRALVVVIFSGIGIALGFGVIGMTLFGTDGGYFVRRSTKLIAGGVFFVVLGFIGISRSLPKLISGKKAGGVD